MTEMNSEWRDATVSAYKKQLIVATEAAIAMQADGFPQIAAEYRKEARDIAATINALERVK